MLDLNIVVMKHNFKQLRLHILLGIVFLVSSVIFFPIENIINEEAIYLAEHYICLVGIILFVPIFMPEDNKGLTELLLSKKVPLTFLWVSRMIAQVIVLFALTVAYSVFLKMNQCTFQFNLFFYCVTINAMFLGGMGIFVYAVLQNWIFGYIVPLFYFIISYFAKETAIIKSFYLFSMQSNSMKEKINLLAAGIFFIVTSFAYLEWSKQKSNHRMD